MKRITTILLLACLIPTLAFAQSQDPEKKSAISIGFLHGGGSLVGADLEFLVSKKIGIQLGAGISSIGAGLHYHVQPTVKSSSIALQYWHQGFSDNFIQSAIGPSFVFRGKKWLTAQIGYATFIDEGEAKAEEYIGPPGMLTYAIGFYLPW